MSRLERRPRPDRKGRPDEPSPEGPFTRAIVLQVEKTHDVEIMQSEDLVGRPRFRIECSCGIKVGGYTSREAAQEGGQRHVDNYA